MAHRHNTGSLCDITAKHRRILSPNTNTGIPNRENRSEGTQRRIFTPLPFYLTSVKGNSGRNEAEHRTGAQEIPLTNVKGQKKDLRRSVAYYFPGNPQKRAGNQKESKFPFFYCRIDIIYCKILIVYPNKCNTAFE